MNSKTRNYQTSFSAYIFAAMVSLNAQAADVTSTFNTGDTLTATQMTEIKDAVNSKQNLVTGTCPADQSIREINPDGTVACTLPSGSSVNLVVIDDSFIGSTEDYTGTADFELLKNVSTYTKLSASSALVITYSDNLRSSNGSGCSISVRVNDIAPDGGRFATPTYTTYLTTQTFFSGTGTYSGIAAGTYNINLYKRVLGVDTVCTRNTGNWDPTITIMEIEP